ncbi:MAG: tetratricopeptide repeat protein [Desulfobacteraceae bacterium]|nr:tetratricopeptide repeat protein [Desulfobacteraceae bacterium]
MPSENPSMDRLMDQVRQQRLADKGLDALESLREALSISPREPVLHSLLALVLVDLNRPRAAVHEARSGVDLGADMPFCHYALGMVLCANEKYAAAIQHLRQALAAEPDNSRYMTGLGNVYALTGNTIEAREHFKKAIWIDPNEADGYTALGRLLRRDGKLAAAGDCIRKAIELNSEGIDARLEMGFIRLLEGEIEEARGHALWALQKSVFNADAVLLLSQIKARTNPLVGAWWKLNGWLTGGSTSRIVLILVFTYALFRIAELGLNDLGYTFWSNAVKYIWLIVVIYSWFGPDWFDNLIRKDLNRIERSAGN